MKYQRSTTFCCKEIEARKSEFVTKTQFLYWEILQWKNVLLEGLQWKNVLRNFTVEKCTKKVYGTYVLRGFKERNAMRTL